MSFQKPEAVPPHESDIVRCQVQLGSTQIQGVQYPGTWHIGCLAEAVLDII